MPHLLVHPKDKRYKAKKTLKDEVSSCTVSMTEIQRIVQHLKMHIAPDVNRLINAVLEDG